MRFNHFRLIHRTWGVSALAVALLASGCGSGKSEDAARIVGYLAANGTATFAMELQSQAQGQALLTKFAKEAGQSVEPQLNVKALQQKSGLGDDSYSCAAASVDGYALAYSCSNLAEDRFSCGGDEYVVASGATVTFAVDAPSETTLKFYLEQNAKVSGGSLSSDGETVQCKLAFEWDLQKLAEAAESGEDVAPYVFSCTGNDMNCKIGDTEITCSELQDAMNDYAASGEACVAAI